MVTPPPDEDQDLTQLPPDRESQPCVQQPVVRSEPKSTVAEISEERLPEQIHAETPKNQSATTVNANGNFEVRLIRILELTD